MDLVESLCLIMIRVFVMFSFGGLFSTPDRRTRQADRQKTYRNLKMQALAIVDIEAFQAAGTVDLMDAGGSRRNILILYSAFHTQLFMPSSAIDFIPTQLVHSLLSNLPRSIPYSKKHGYIHRPSSPHHRRPTLLIKAHATTQPLHRLRDPRPRQRTTRQDPTVPDIPALLALKHSPHKPLFNPHNLDTILTVLLIRQNQNRHTARIFVLQHRLQHQPALVQPPDVVGRGGQVCERRVAHVAAVDDEDNGVAAGVVALPEAAQTMLAANVPYLEVYGRVWRRQFDGRDVLADGGHSFEVRVRGRVRGFDLL
jgi:hypothetical protein